MHIKKPDVQNKLQRQLTFAKVPLPAPPAPKQQNAEVVKEAMQAKLTPATQVIYKTEAIQKIKAVAKIEPKVHTQLQTTVESTRPTVTAVKHADNAKADSEQTQKVFQQLQQAQGLDLQIAWPQQTSKRNAVLGYLYRCAGAQFAVLEQQQLTYLSPKRYVTVSQWLRVAQGALSPAEQDWLKHSAGTPVRIFPQSIDWQLAQHISQQLGGAKLHSLRAVYGLAGNRLQLTNVLVNGQKSPNNWPIYNGQCHA